MTHRISGAISLLLCKRAILDEEDIEIYQYGIEIFLDAILETLLLIVLGLVLNCFVEALFFVVIFTLLRKYAGGYHATTKPRCILLTILIFLFNVVSAQYIPEAMSLYVILCGVVSSIIICVYAPVLHYNKELYENEIKMNRCVTWGVCAVYMIGMFILRSYFIIYSNMLAIALFEIAILIIVGEVKYNEKHIEGS